MVDDLNETMRKFLANIEGVERMERERMRRESERREAHTRAASQTAESLPRLEAALSRPWHEKVWGKILIGVGVTILGGAISGVISGLVVLYLTR